MCVVWGRNCNHFANALCTQLLGKGIPGYLNRLAFVGKRRPPDADPDPM